MNKYQGKRFAGFLISIFLLSLCFAFGPVASFSAYATALGLMYGAYLGGQSATDHKKIEVNGGTA